MKTKSKKNLKNTLNKWLKKVLSQSHMMNEKEVDSPWPEYEELALLPLDELEQMIEQEAAKERATLDKVHAKTVENLDSSQNTCNTIEKVQAPHIADLSQKFPNPPLIQCYTIDSEDTDPNLRITHYPPSNSLH